MLLAMLAERNVEKFDLSSLRQIIYGASPIPLELLRKSLRVFKHTGFFQVYGLTETTGVITVLVAADHSAGDDEILRSCGRLSKASNCGSSTLPENRCRLDRWVKSYAAHRKI
jgi:fatty-acyl-CoA synthase